MSKGFNSWFIGPKGENARIVEDLLLEAFRDHLYWRKNFHPEDPQDIQEIDKISVDYQESVAHLRKCLFQVLAEIKQSVPFYSPRYIGHMTSDPLIPGIIGYIATMFYNPNNVSPLGSPVTTDYEIEVGKDFARLMGYEAEKSWGHITSGGTVANFEALWVARNLKYFPLAVKKATEVLKQHDFEINNQPIKELATWQLLNLPPKHVLSLRERLIDHIRIKRFRDKSFGPSQNELNEIERDVDDTILEYSVSRIGWDRFLKIFEKDLNGIEPGVVLVPQTKHYSWTKGMDLLGLGSHNLQLLSITEDYRIDISSLAERIEDLTSKRTPIIMVVLVFGSTEEGSIDPIEEIASICNNYYKHVDAAYGGYFASLLYRARTSNKRSDTDLGDLEQFKSMEDFKKAIFEILDTANIDKQVGHLWKSLSALKNCDSVTIDPHKLGYIPIPAGGIVFRDRKVRELISFTAPYAFGRGESDKFIGQYILEGSKPGASAVACYLAHKVVPPTIEGYGYILARTIRAARRLYDGVKQIGIDNIRIVPIAEPDTNIFCFVVNYNDNPSLTRLNRLNNAVYEQFSLKRETPLSAYNFLISKTDFTFDEYSSDATNKLLKELGISGHSYTRLPKLQDQDNKITVLRMAAMNPWNDQYVSAFVEELTEVLKSFIHKILLVEDEEPDREKIKISFRQNAGGLDEFIFASASTWEKGEKLVKDETFDVVILDLLLPDINEKLCPDGGCFVLNTLREKEKGLNRKTPVVIYTQFNLADQEEVAKDEHLLNLKEKLESAGFIKDLDEIVWKQDPQAEIKAYSRVFQRLKWMRS